MHKYTQCCEVLHMLGYRPTSWQVLQQGVRVRTWNAKVFCGTDTGMRETVLMGTQYARWVVGEGTQDFPSPVEALLQAGFQVESEKLRKKLEGYQE
jgi:hypothetical protein